MFDAHICYYAYNNLDGDEFGVGMIGNKVDWVKRFNRWGEEDGTRHDFTSADFEDIPFEAMRGIQLAEVVRDEDDHLVTWSNKNNDYTVRLEKNGTVSWEENPNNLSSVPRWIKRLHTTLKTNDF